MPELLPTDADVPALIDSHGEKAYIVEDEVGCKITEKGRSKRATIHFEPRESLVSKLINRFEVKLNLKSIFTE